jgi:hypothetical protein
MASFVCIVLSVLACVGFFPLSLICVRLLVVLLYSSCLFLLSPFRFFFLVCESVYEYPLRVVGHGAHVF